MMKTNITNKTDIFVTGANGFIANNFIYYLKSFTGFNVYGISRGNNYITDNCFYTDYVDSNWLRDKLKLKNNYILIHTAAYIPQDNHEDDIDVFNINKRITDFLINVFGGQNIRVILFSSISVYGYGYKDLLNITEDEPIFIKNYYAMSKFYEEQMFRRVFGRLYILRLSSPYGKNKTKNSILEIMMRKAARGEDIVIYRQGDRLQDFIYIEDICRVIYQLITKIINYGIYNLASGYQCKMLDLANMTNELYNYRSKIRFVDYPEGFSVSINNQKLRSVLPIKFTALSEGLKKLIGQC